MKSTLLALLAVCSLPVCLLAQSAGPPYSIVGAAGAPFVLGDGGPATSAVLKSPGFIAVDGAGNLYIGESLGYRFRKVAPSGVITTIAGTGSAAAASAGIQATTATINNAGGIAVDNSGNIYFAEEFVWKISASGALVSVVGSGNGYGGDGGLATAATANTVAGMKFDQAGNLYLADRGNNRIRKINGSGIIATVAGSGTAGFGGDGTAATAAKLSSPYDVAVDASGNLYIADQGNNRIRKVTPDGTISTYAGTGTAGSSGDGGSAASAQLNSPAGLVIDSVGRLYVSESGGARIRRITPTATGTLIQTVAGNGTAGFQGDGGLATSGEIDTPWGLAMDSSGDLYIAEEGASQRVRQVTPSGIISTVAGATHFAGDGGPAALARMGFPQSVAVSNSGNLYIPDTQNRRIRQVAPDGKIRTIAGNGSSGNSGDGGQAVNATLYNPTRITLDAAGNIYFSAGSQVRMITPGGVISTVAGTGNNGSGGDGGPATLAELNSQRGLAVDSNNNLYIADYVNNKVRMVTAEGIISTVAGTGTAGFGGDGGPATSAMLYNPADVAVDSAGNLYIADLNNFRVRKVDSENVISTVAGNGQSTYAGDGGLATAAAIREVDSVAVDGANRIFVGDLYNGRIRMVDSNGIISTVAGTGTRISGGDGGLATAATMGGNIDAGYGLALGPGGVVYFADTLGEEIRQLTPHVPQLTILSGSNQSALPGTLLPNPLIVTIADPVGVGFPGITVTFAVTSGSAKLSSSSTVTGANGQAGISVTLGATTGPVVVTASSAGLPSVTFNLTSGSSTYTCSNTAPPVITSVDSASSYGGYPYFASGSWLEIKGTNMADPADPRLSAATNPGQWTSSDFNGVNAPTSLDGISVSINGKPAYVWYLSTTQLNVQAPEDSATGNVAITVTNCNSASPPFTFARQALAPGLLAPSNYSVGGTQYMVATFASDGAYVLNTSAGVAFGLNSRPAKPGDLIIAYGIGFGDVTPTLLPGAIVQQSNALVNPVTFSFGSTNAALAYSGLAGGFVGLYEFYITVPSSLANGDYQITVTQNGTNVPQTMYLTVHN